MVTFEQKLEFILDNGLECRCCPFRKSCNGKVKHTAAGPVLPACGERDFKDILDPKSIERLYRTIRSKGYM